MKLDLETRERWVMKTIRDTYDWEPIPYAELADEEYGTTALQRAHEIIDRARVAVERSEKVKRTIRYTATVVVWAMAALLAMAAMDALDLGKYLFIESRKPPVGKKALDDALPQLRSRNAESSSPSDVHSPLKNLNNR